MSTIAEFLNSQVESLYYLRGKDITLLEIKRLNVPNDRPKSEIYLWILFDNLKQSPRILEFERIVNEKNRDGQTHRVFRFFKDSSLIYDNRDQTWHYRIGNVFHILINNK